jgi:tetratricopeptide (TPR) repeat protein
MSQAKYLLLAAALCGATAARAQEAAAPTATPDPKAAAAEAYRTGVAEFEAGEFAEALASFTEAYNLSQETDLLYNLGVCSEKVGDREKAIAYYQLYLEEKPDAADAAQVRNRLAALREEGAKAEPAAPPSRPVAAAVDEERGAAPPGDEGLKRNPNAGPAVVIGLGAIVVVTGAITAASAYKKYKDLDSTCSPDCTSGQVDGVRRPALAADIQFGIGGAAVVAGLLWYLLGTRPAESADADTETTARFAAAPFAAGDGGGVQLEGRF